MFFFSVIGAIQMRYDDDDDESLVSQRVTTKPNRHLGKAT